VNLEKHITYWRKSSDEDIKTAEILIDKSRLRHGLFFAHLAVEKMLKAHVCQKTKEAGPRIHNLLRLAQLTKLDFTEERKTFFARFDRYQIEGRYPEFSPVEISQASATKELKKAKEILQWLKSQLEK